MQLGLAGWLGLRPGWLGLRPGWLGLRPGWVAQRGQWTDGWMDERTDRKSPHSTGLCPLSRPLPSRYPACHDAAECDDFLLIELLVIDGSMMDGMTLD